MMIINIIFNNVMYRLTDRCIIERTLGVVVLAD